MRWGHLAVAALFLTLNACDEDDEAAAPNDGGTDGPIEKADGALCPPPLETPAPGPTARPMAGPMDDVLRLDQLQAKATHNSYHIQKAGSLAEFAYTHAPLDVQLESQGVRALEIDVHFDYECNRHEVFHLPLVDDVSTCRQFTECLGIVRKWSDEHLGHHPLFVQIEPKNDGPDDAALRLDTLEKEILSVFPRDAVITPDEVRGSSSSLAEAIARGWPTLGKTRGRVLFYMLASGGMRDVYTHGGKDLAGRLMFVSSNPAEPFASVAVVDDPVAGATSIAAALDAGMLVRTFAEKFVALETAAEQSKAALDSGAQIIATDFPVKTGSSTWVFPNPGTPSRCNVKNAPTGCTSEAVEDPKYLATPR